MSGQSLGGGGKRRVKGRARCCVGEGMRGGEGDGEGIAREGFRDWRAGAEVGRGEEDDGGGWS